jgi:1-acyl-sn-glycerol-3-phosphate acyltransferase
MSDLGMVGRNDIESPGLEKQSPEPTRMSVATTPKGRRLTGLAYFPRWLAGVTCYAVFGLGGLLSSLTLLPLLRCWPGTEQQKIRRVQGAVSWMFKGFVHMLHWGGLLTVTVPGRQALEAEQGLLVIANHPTLLDVVVLISLIPNAGCIVKQSLWRNPFMRGVLSCAGYIPNRGADHLLDDCRQVLDKRTKLIIFPEGTRTPMDQSIGSFARGAANIALRAEADLLPVILHTDVRGFTKEEPWYAIPRQTIQMRIALADIIRCDSLDNGLEDQSIGNAKKSRRLTRQLEQLFTQQLDKHHETK